MLCNIRRLWLVPTVRFLVSVGFRFSPCKLFPRARLRRNIRGFGNQPETGNRGCRQKLEPKIFSRNISTARCGAFASSVTPGAEMKWLFFQPDAACISVAALQRNTVTELQRNTIVAPVTALVQPFQYIARRSARLYRRDGANVRGGPCDVRAAKAGDAGVVRRA